MTLQDYLQNKKSRGEQDSCFRSLCVKCWQPSFCCYCSEVQTFNPKIEFLILIHPIEVRRRIATGRMSHLILENSTLIAGQDFSDHAQVNLLLARPEVFPMVLYPGPTSVDIAVLSMKQRGELVPKGKKLMVIVIDGTWATAKKTIRLSTNIRNLPRICFSSDRVSQFKVRKQPDPECYSTLEAIHQTIELLGPAHGFDIQSRQQDRLLKVFNLMVERQLGFVENNRRYRRSRRSAASSVR